jgi:hypothetical protein
MMMMIAAISQRGAMLFTIITRVMNSRRMRWAGRVACMEDMKY